MKKAQKQLLAAIIVAGITFQASAEDNPGEILNAAANAVNDIASKNLEKSTPEERWHQYLALQGWDKGKSNEGVVVDIPDRDGLIVSTGKYFVSVDIGQPGWIESRVAGFEIAELEAKAKIIRYLGEKVTTERRFKFMRDSATSDGEAEEIEKMDEVNEVLKKIGNKSLALVDKTLDAALRKLDADYDPDEFERLTPEEKKKTLEGLLRKKVSIRASQMLIGVTSVYATEGKVGDGYKVLVGVVWSPNLKRLATSMFNDEYNIPEAKIQGKVLDKQVPDDQLTLLGTVGTRIVIDEKGHYAVLSYAQSAPHHAPVGRQQAALEQAQKSASDRARAGIVNFIKEGMTFSKEEETEEVVREFDNGSYGTNNLSKVLREIHGKRTSVDLRGVFEVKKWTAEHPETGQKVAGAIIAWTPTSAEQSKKMKKVINEKPKKAIDVQTGVGTATPEKKTPIIQSGEVPTSAY